jgi:hypothetical protein
MNNPCNDFNPTPLRMIVVDPVPAAGARPSAAEAVHAQEGAA